MTYQMFTLACALFLLVATPFLWRFRPRLSVARLLPALATVGEPCAYRLRLENRGTRVQDGLLVDDCLRDPRPTLRQFLRAGAPPNARSFIERHSGYARWRWLIQRSVQAPTQALVVDKLPPGQTMELETHFTPLRRGVLRFEAVTLARADPLGLLKACREIRSPRACTCCRGATDCRGSACRVHDVINKVGLLLPRR